MCFLSSTPLNLKFLESKRGKFVRTKMNSGEAISPFAVTNIEFTQQQGLLTQVEQLLWLMQVFVVQVAQLLQPMQVPVVHTV